MAESSHPQHELLLRWKVALQGACITPPEVATWLLQGIEDLESGRAHTLCRALGLRGPGQRSLKTIEDHRQRNLLLNQAFGNTLGADPQADDTTRCNILVDAISRLDRAWPRMPTIQATWEAEMYQRLAEIKKLVAAGGPDLPRSPRQIFALVRPRL